MKCEKRTDIGQLLVCRLHGQEKDVAEDSCFWADVYLDCVEYSLLAASDCGTFYYSWDPTPHTETFPSLLRRLNEGYLLEKLSGESSFRLKETIRATQKFLVDGTSDDGSYDIEKDMKAALHDLAELEEESISCLDAYKRRVDNILELHLYGTMCSVMKASLEEQDYCAVHDYPQKAKRFVRILHENLAGMLEGAV